MRLQNAYGDALQSPCCGVRNSFSFLWPDISHSRGLPRGTFLRTCQSWPRRIPSPRVSNIGVSVLVGVSVVVYSCHFPCILFDASETYRTQMERVSCRLFSIITRWEGEQLRHAGTGTQIFCQKPEYLVASCVGIPVPYSVLRQSTFMMVARVGPLLNLLLQFSSTVSLDRLRSGVGRKQVHVNVSHGTKPSMPAVGERGQGKVVKAGIIVCREWPYSSTTIAFLGLST